MSRVNDVGGMAGFPAVIEEPDEPPFHSDWEAHVFALNGALIKRGVYNLDEFRDAQERLPVQQYLAASYYERWFAAITTLLAEKGVVAADELELPHGPTPPGTPGCPGTPGARSACWSSRPAGTRWPTTGPAASRRNRSRSGTCGSPPPTCSAPGTTRSPSSSGRTT
jgi:hypothetical protein